MSASKVTHAEFRKLKAINKQQFLEDIRNSSLYRDPPNTLDELVECYNNTLRSVLDKHAPVRARDLKSQSRPPWFNDEIAKARRERRSAERKWRASRLNSDLAVFKAKRNFALHVMNESRRAYYKQYIDENSSDQGRLFRASKRLLNFHVDRALPPHSDARMLANEMGEYFVHISRLFGLRWMQMPVAQLRLPHQPQRVVSFLNFLHCLRRVYGELLPHVQSRAPLIPYHRLFCPSVWMNYSLLLGKLSTCLLSLASLQRTGRML